MAPSITLPLAPIVTSLCRSVGSDLNSRMRSTLAPRCSSQTTSDALSWTTTRPLPNRFARRAHAQPARPGSSASSSVPSIRTHSMRRALSYCTPQDEEGVSTAWPCSEAHQTTRGVFRGCRIGCRWQRTSLLIRWRPNNGRSVTACSTKAAGATKRRTAQHTVRPGVLVTVLVVRTSEVLYVRLSPVTAVQAS